jgi:hypothetical protein
MQDGAAAAVTGGSVARLTAVVTGGSVVAGTVRVVDVAGATVVVVVEVEGAMLAGVDPVVADTVGRAGLPQEVAEKATTIVSAPTIASRAPALVSVNRSCKRAIHATLPSARAHATGWEPCPWWRSPS